MSARYPSRVPLIVHSTRRVSRDASAELNRVLLELVLGAIVLGEPAADLRAELVRLSLPRDRPAPPDGLIEFSILGLRSDTEGAAAAVALGAARAQPPGMKRLLNSTVTSSLSLSAPKNAV
jgi:hypothetical protein